MLSSSWFSISRSGTAWQSSSNRSARVDLPWSMWAMMEKLRILDWSVIVFLSSLVGVAFGGAKHHEIA